MGKSFVGAYRYRPAKHSDGNLFIIRYAIDPRESFTDILVLTSNGNRRLFDLKIWKRSNLSADFRMQTDMNFISRSYLSYTDAAMFILNCKAKKVIVDLETHSHKPKT